MPPLQVGAVILLLDEWLKNPEYSEDGETLSVISSAVTDTYVDRIMESYAHYKEVY